MLFRRQFRRLVPCLARISHRTPSRQVAGEKCGLGSFVGVPLAATAGVLVVVSFLIRWPLLRVREFDPDEFAHLHGAWSISQGLLPYRDYFEHHTPGLTLLLAPFFTLFNVETQVDDAIAFLFFARRCMWLASALIVVSFFVLAGLWRGRGVACVATVLLANTPVFVGKTTDVRPDVLSTLSLVVALACTMAVLRADVPGRGRGCGVFIAGILLGAGILCTQKLVVVLPGFAVAILWRTGVPSPFSSRARLLSVHLCGVAVPLLMAVVYFWLHDGLRAFWTYNVVWNATWRHRFWPFEFPLTIAASDPLLVGAAGAGFVQVLRQLSRGQGAEGTDALLVFTLPVAYLQYYLVFFPFAALFAASFLVGAIEARWHPRAQDRTLALLLLAASLYPLAQLAGTFSATNTAQLTAIRYVHANTRPDDTVFDEYSGFGVFRPHAWFFWFLHGEVRAMLEEEDYARVLDDMRCGRMRPALVAVTSNIRDRSPEWRALLERYYEAAGLDPIWKRRPSADASEPPADRACSDGTVAAAHPSDRSARRRARDSRTK
jgi:hypothetical protein